MECLSELKKLQAALGFDRQAVGVKFFYDQEAYAQEPAKEPSTKMAYCVMVRIASTGRASKSTLKQHDCGGATRALGLTEPSEQFLTGAEYFDFGLYETKQVAHNVASHITLCSRKTYGVAIKPLSQYTEPPDVVLIITDSFNTMRIIQGYTYKFGCQASFKLQGNQAVCSECTAYPLETDAINISAFCSGTRYLAGWRQDELCIGIPFGKFLATCEGVYATINGAEQNERKQQILANIEEAGLEAPHIGQDEAYYIRYRKGQAPQKAQGQAP